MTPPLKRVIVDHDDGYMNETHIWVAFKVRDADDRMNKLTCTVDRLARTTSVAPTRRAEAKAG